MKIISLNLVPTPALAVVTSGWRRGYVLCLSCSRNLWTVTRVLMEPIQREREKDEHMRRSQIHKGSGMPLRGSSFFFPTCFVLFPHVLLSTVIPLSALRLFQRVNQPQSKLSSSKSEALVLPITRRRSKCLC